MNVWVVTRGILVLGVFEDEKDALYFMLEKDALYFMQAESIYEWQNACTVSFMAVKSKVSRAKRK